MAKAQKNTAAIVRELICDTVCGLGYELWDVEFVKEGSEWYLRITIDAEDGIDISDCEAVTHAVDPLLDEADPIEQSYRLEVSSPGLERVIRTPEHYAACLGWKVCAKLFTAIDGNRVFTGILGGYDEQAQEVLLQTADGNTVRIPHTAISRMNAVYDFENESL